MIELKALSSFNELWFRRQAERQAPTPPNLMFSELAGDFQKLLDRKLPKQAFRYSWVVTKNQGRSRPDEIAQWARSILRPVEGRLSLEGLEEKYDPMTGWLAWKWKDGTILHLAWYSPSKEARDTFVPVWVTNVARQVLS